MIAMKVRIGDIASWVDGEVVGDPAYLVDGVASLSSASATSIVFAESERALEAARDLAIGCLLLPAAASPPRGIHAVRVANPKLAFALIVSRFHSPASPWWSGVHATAVVSPEATVHPSARLGPHVVVDPGASIGADTILHAGVSIGAGSRVGEACILFPRVTVYHDVTLGNRVVLHAGAVIGADGFGYVRHEGRYTKFPQIGTVILEDDVEIGANSTVDRGALDATIVKRGTKIDNLVQIGHNVTLGENCVVSAQTGIAGSTVVEDQVTMGGQVGIADHCRIETGAILGAQTGVPSGKVIRAGQVVWGTPARPMARFRESYSEVQRLPKLRQALEDLAARIRALEKNER